MVQETTPVSISTRTRNTLVDAARTVFTERGYAATRIADITGAAGVSVGTFYNYFDTKHDILDAVLAGLAGGLFELEPSAKSAPLPDQLYRLNRRYLEAFAAEASAWYAIERAALVSVEVAHALEAARRRQVSGIETLIRQWQTEGVTEPKVEPEFTAFALTAMVEECAYLWFIYESAPPLEDAARDLADIWLRALQGAGVTRGERPTR